MGVCHRFAVNYLSCSRVGREHFAVIYTLAHILTHTPNQPSTHALTNKMAEVPLASGGK